MEQNRPRIGIPVPNRDIYVNYFVVLETLGADPVLITAGDDPAAFDGLLLPGGGDADPIRYGQPNRGSVRIDPALDELQLSALDRFFLADKPILGICRGHQLLNIYFGGTLIQDIGSCVKTNVDHAWAPGSREDRVHITNATPGSRIAELYGERFAVNSAHHQAVDRPGEGIIIDQRSEDGIAEALHHATAPVYGVQWHPERMCLTHLRKDTVDGARLLLSFLTLCTDPRT